MLRTKVVAVAGRDFAMRDPVWLSRFGSASRLAERYRQGRILLAGDAAHRHFPAGGVGMNVGIQDAMNLGWKLAAVARGHAGEDLLDTYHDERHPVGEDLVEGSRAQVALMTAFSPEGLALRSLLNKLVAERPEFSLGLAERLSGHAVIYPSEGPAAHPLVGRRAPDLAFPDAETNLFGLLRPGRHVLLDLTDGGTVPAADGITVHTGPLAEPPAAWSAVRATLIRPDGHVAWASEESDDEALATAASKALAAIPGVRGHDRLGGVAQP